MIPPSKDLSKPLDLGQRTNIDVLNELLDLRGKSVVDAGCGDMGFTRSIVDAGAQVLAIDPDARQAELNRKQPDVPGLRFVETGAENLPVEDASLDGIFFVYSLHHVPLELYSRVFEEAFRAIKPGGFLHVIEPTSCPLNDIMMLFHDEEAERQAAQSALARYALPRFESVRSIKYHGIRQFDDFEHFVREFSGRTFNPGYTESDVRADAVQELFERHGAPDYRFEAPKTVHCFTGLKPSALTD
ncbi:MAG: hypothetical protein Aurels2KO_34140 [Aureliella sp.]